jgi:uncharacterized protein (UPF0276 family)
MFNPVVPSFLRAHPDAVDYLAVIPETLWTDHGRGAPARYEYVPAAMEELNMLAERLPIVCHGIGLSIGSALELDEEHLLQLRRVLLQYDVTRFSEHLGFSRVADSRGADRHVGLGFPVPCDETILTWLAPRVRRAMDVLGLPLLLENGVRHTPLIEEDMPEAIFLNRLAAETGCGMLLDLHNLYTDCRNNGWQAADYLDLLDLRIVREIHAAGGSVIGKAYTDSHAGPCPPEVWKLLNEVVPRCVNLEGITFEFHDSYYPTFGPEVLLAELKALSTVWRSRISHVT